MAGIFLILIAWLVEMPLWLSIAITAWYSIVFIGYILAAAVGALDEAYKNVLLKQYNDRRKK